MPHRDLALVLGVASYPNMAGRGRSSNLESPINDAEAFGAWLAAPEGGAVPGQRIYSLTSRQKADISYYDVEELFARIDEQLFQQACRRVYIFMSGHGFSPDLSRVGLFSSRASARRPREHVHADGWADWLCGLGSVEELVLLLDCCREQLTVPMNPSCLREEFSPGAAPRRFYAYAVKPYQLATEVDYRGKKHGAFTAALLDGLCGGAAVNGAITTGGLKNFLNTSLKERVEQVTKEPSIGREPGFGPQDDFLLVQPNSSYLFSVTLTPPAALDPGEPLRIFTSDLRTTVQQFPAPAGPCEASLPRGFFALLCSQGLFPFEVHQDGEVRLGRP